MNSFLNSDIKYAKGLGEARANLLNKELGIHTFSELLDYYPFRYVDRSMFHRISDVDQEVQFYQIKGRITRLDDHSFGKNERLSALFTDGTDMVELVWFKGVKWIKNQIKLDQDVVLYGKPTRFKGKINFAHPELEYDMRKQTGFEPIYSCTELMRNKRFESKAIRKVMHQLIRHEKWDVPEIFPPSILSKLRLISRSDAYRFIHEPKSQHEIDLAYTRLKFDELFFLQYPFIRQKLNRKNENQGIVFDQNPVLVSIFLKEVIPFSLTNAQTKVLQEIKEDLSSGSQMNRLLQGDVGSGKTVVAFLTMLMALDNGHQASIMAPTEILATQHYLGLKEWAQQLGIQVALLTGSTSASERKEIHRLLRSGHIHILIGTHALIEDTVIFKDLGMVIIDEQHRFGVAQRAKLQEKGKRPPHVLVMTATPIPRTLAMSLYGDLDYSVIDELPSGRKEIITAHRFGFAREKVWEFIKEEVDKGRQAYIVYPLIEESDKLHYKDLNNGYDELLKYFKRPQYQVDMLHGQMKASDKEATMQRFKRRESHILVSTTVIEVGINVPNATIMVIESAEKFGLSQLHQLRGRVGRGGEQSYCILMSSKKLSENAETRLKAMVSTTSGFTLSEIDMQLRGFGDIAGTRQSGLDQLKLSSLGKDQSLAQLARTTIIKLLSEYPDLGHPSLSMLKHYIKSRSDFKEWSTIA